MARIARFEDIEGWRKGRELRKAIYRVSDAGNFAKDQGLKNQIRRAAVSITSNIAEGFERGGNREFIQFLATSKGSCAELRDQLYVALDQSYISQQQFDEMYGAAEEVAKIIGGLMRSLQKSDYRGAKFQTPL